MRSYARIAWAAFAMAACGGSDPHPDSVEAKTAATAIAMPSHPPVAPSVDAPPIVVSVTVAPSASAPPATKSPSEALAAMVGLDFDNAFTVKSTWQIEQESAFGTGGLGLLIMRHEADLAAAVSSQVGPDPHYVILSTKLLGPLCEGCVIETLCHTGSRLDPWTFGMMDASEVCGGWLKAHPKKAWRGNAKGILTEVSVKNVTCGTQSCEGP